MRYFRWWAQTRALDGDGLVYIIHGWESGLDASPAYDGAYGIPEFDPIPRFAQVRPTGGADIVWEFPCIAVL